MTFDEASPFLRQHKDIARPGRKLRFLTVGLFDLASGKFVRTEFTAADRAATDWEAVEQ